MVQESTDVMMNCKREKEVCFFILGFSKGKIKINHCRIFMLIFLTSKWEDLTLKFFQVVQQHEWGCCIRLHKTPPYKSSEDSQQQNTRTTDPCYYIYFMVDPTFFFLNVRLFIEIIETKGWKGP